MLLGAYRVIYEQWSQHNDISKRRIEFSLKKALKKDLWGRKRWLPMARNERLRKDHDKIRPDPRDLRLPLHGQDLT